MNRISTWLLTIIAGIAVGAGTHVWLVEDPLLAGSLAVVYATLVWLMIEFGSELPGAIHGDDWRTLRWSMATTAFVMGAALFGVSTALPISNDLRLVLQLLVLGVGYVGMLFGVAMTRAQFRNEGSAGDRDTGTDGERTGLADTKGL